MIKSNLKSGQLRVNLKAESEDRNMRSYMLDPRVPNVHGEGNRRESNINQTSQPYQSQNRGKPNQPLQRDDRHKSETVLLLYYAAGKVRGEPPASIPVP